MSVTVSSIMSRAVVSVHPEDTVRTAVELMNRHYIGAVMVTDRHKPLGIITERDILKALVAGAADVLGMRAADLMHAPLVSALPDLTVPEAADLMAANRVKRLPVISRGRLRGIVSTRDVTNALRKANELLQKKTRALSDRARHDPLTGLYNKTVIAEKLKYHMALARRTGKSMAVLMIDIDHFKHVNDTYGHPCGDRVLKGLAGILRDKSREVNVVGRYGGEEFIIIAPIADYKAARFLGERLRAEVEDTVFKCGRKTVRITISVGVAEWHRSVRSGAKMVAAADTALYRAKENGRNRVEVDGG